MTGACVLIFCRWTIGLAFAVSAIGKVTSLASFQSTIAQLRLLPPRLARPAAIASVVVEAVAAIGVAAGGVLAAAGFSLAAVLLAVFTCVLVVALRQNASVSCNCFGPGERRISRYDLLRNGLLGLCCAGGLWAGAARAASAATRPGAGLDVTLGLIAAAFLVITINLEDFVEVIRKPYLID